MDLKKEHIIWDSFRKGNKDALEVIYEENYSALYYYGLKINSNSEAVKDSIHELFIELIDSGERLSKTDNIRFYLLKALRNKLIKKGRLISDSELEGLGKSDFSLIESVEHQLISKEIEEDRRNKILTAIEKLSEKQQEIIYFRFYNDLSYQQIAEVYNTRVQTVRNLMSRALQSLKEDFRNNKDQLLLFFLRLPHF